MGLAIEVERIGAVGVVTLANPRKRNALAHDHWVELGVQFAELAQDPDVNVLLLTGRGSSFCAGVDLYRGEGNIARSMIPVIHRAVLELHRCPKPVIAAIEGACLGAGWSLALACDLLIGGEGAFFEPPFPSRGMLPGRGIVWFLGHRLGRHELARMLWCDVRYDAEQAYQRGLLSQVVAGGEALRTGLGVAKRLAGGPATTLRISKAIMRRSLTPYLEVALNGEDNDARLNYSQDDALAARQAFIANLGNR